MEEKIRIENVTKKFGSYAALDGISLNFEKGKIHGIIGRNGSGKTVLFKCICGFLRGGRRCGFGEWKTDRKKKSKRRRALALISKHRGFSGIQRKAESAVSCRHPRENRKERDRRSHPEVGLDPEAKARSANIPRYASASASHRQSWKIRP